MFCTLATLISFCFTCAGAPQATQKPVVQAPIVTDYFDIPATLEGFIARSDAVVIATVLSARDASQQQRARTKFRVRVTEVFKNDPDLGVSVDVCRSTGRVEFADRVVQTVQPGFPDFDVGSEYLLFLKRDQPSGCYWSTFGPSTAALIDSLGRTKPFNDHPAIRSLTGLDRTQLAQRFLPFSRK